MKKKIEKNIHENRNGENGIALLFALSILSLLLVLTLAFASNSIFDQKTAYNSANMSRTRMMAQSAFSKTMVLISQYGDAIKNSGRDTYIDPNAPSKLNSTYNGLTHLNISTSTVMFEWQPTYKNSIGWNYLKKADGELIGRYAYVILPNTLNANDIAKLNVNEGAYAEERVGNEVNEINVRSLNDLTPSTISATLATKFNYTTGTQTHGMQPTAGWGNMTDMFSLLGLTTAPATRIKFSQWLVVNDTKTGEYFLGNKVNNTVDANVEKFNRFYLPYFTDENNNLVYEPTPTPPETPDTNKWDALVTTSPSYSVAQMYNTILLDSNADGTPDA
ncbi:MAG: hypothetical protein WC071_11950, partial [Victivallaceae bacterium]